jgi:UDP-N-acetylglucosamine 2-epimerase (non-hydrolysing)
VSEHQQAAAETNVLVLIGTRPEAIKLFPVVLALRRSTQFEPIVITTGQHRDLVDPILELAGIVPDHDLGVGHRGFSLNGLVVHVIDRLSTFCHERFGAEGVGVAGLAAIRAGFPVATLVHGDTSSAMAAGLASFHLRIPVAHVEAGLRTRTTLSPFPEELNRQLIGRIASLHLAPTSNASENLIRERIPYDRIFVTGNTGIDALRFASELEAEFDDPRVADAVESGERIVVVTAHRRENWHGGLGRIAHAIARAAAEHQGVRFIVPLHPNPLVREELGEPLAASPNVLRTEPLGYASFARLMSRATLIVTDSGGIQEEAPALDVPVLVTRDSTERSEGVEAGTLELVGTDPGRVFEAIDRLLRDPGERALIAGRVNPYGDGQASDRIVAALEWIADVAPPPVRFGPGFSRAAVLTAAGYRGGLVMASPPEPRDVQPDRSEELDRWVGR